MNTTHIKHIVDAMNQDKLIIFVGAGVSKNSGLPNWGELIEEFKDELNLDDENDYLKIPQYYFDTFGQQKYLDKIIEIFDRHSHATSNDIHDQIYEINPKHIITTNYDALIEDRMNHAIKKYEVIKEDLDIPYSLSGNYIIKMHGDISKKNFVLKEDDYFNYENQYQMISTLIKSLIMNNTILFIGYSLSDSTFNSIFRLINNYFGSNAKNAYFYTATKTSSVRTEYYNRKGIKVLTNDTKENKHLNKGKKTTLFLQNIVDYQIPKYETEEDIWSQIKIFEEMSFIEGGDLIKNIEMNDTATLDPATRNSFEWKKDDNNKPKLSDDGRLLNFIKEKTDIINFLENSTTNSKSYKPNEVLNAAFNLYKNGEYSRAIKLFRKIANKSLERKDYLNFLIAEFNVNHLRRIVERTKKKELMSLEDSIFKNVVFADIIENIYDDSDENNKKVISFLKEEIFNFKYLHQKLFKINNLYSKIKLERHNSINKGESFNNHLYLLKNQIDGLNHFLNLNCICLQHYKEYHSIINVYFEALLIAYDIDYRLGDNTELNSSSRIGAFNKKDLKNILPFIDSKMIPVYFDYFDIKKIEITEEAYTYLTNEIISLAENEILSKRSLKYSLLRKYITFLKYIEIHNFGKIIDILKKVPLNWEMYREIRYILLIIFTNYETLEQKDKMRLPDIVNRHLNEIFNRELDFHDRNFRFYSLIIKEYNREFTDQPMEVDIKQLDETLILIQVEQHKTTKIKDYENLIINFYNYLPTNSQNIINHIFEKYDCLPTDEINYSFVTTILINKLYRFDNSIHPLFEHLILEANKKKDDGISVFPDPKERALGNLYNLCINGYYSKEKIRDKINIEITKGVLAEFDWLIFEDFNTNVLDKLIENRKLENVEEYFVNNKRQKEVLTKWKNQKIDQQFN